MSNSWSKWWSIEVTQKITTLFTKSDKDVNMTTKTYMIRNTTEMTNRLKKNQINI